ncbi:hypothetical protein QBC45DRAFT_425286 [Copromyces sp. CBS 386.78]|nr:hypothetical protein QBC45DRAFT_425286 [Copromyces sp. CBS 386.78]
MILYRVQARSFESLIFSLFVSLLILRALQPQRQNVFHVIVPSRAVCGAALTLRTEIQQTQSHMPVGNGICA